MRRSRGFCAITSFRIIVLVSNIAQLLELGLCSAVSYLRDSAEANISVRVGVHSGRVESAIVGLSRWHYDVWSAGVQLAEHVVHAGLPGSVSLLSKLT